METCVNFKIATTGAGASMAHLQICEFAETFLDEIGLELTRVTGLPVSKGVFSGCFGRLVGEPEVSTALNFILENDEVKNELTGGFFCWESPKPRFLFFRRPVGLEARATLESVVIALRVILDVSPRISEMKWMDIDSFAKSE